MSIQKNTYKLETIAAIFCKLKMRSKETSEIVIFIPCLSLPHFSLYNHGSAATNKRFIAYKNVENIWIYLP